MISWKRIRFFFRSGRLVKTVKQADAMGLIHRTNIHGDPINNLNCRSLWVDEFGFTYRCAELLTGGRDPIGDAIAQAKKEYPHVFAKWKEDYKLSRTDPT